ncbi:MAG TPA: tetratricopeptide repeat protein, partial [Planctomycetia bacterium]|nr:tetratricopeptide repeat protein [Planctomycetia bacterium]
MARKGYYEDDDEEQDRSAYRTPWLRRQLDAFLHTVFHYVGMLLRAVVKGVYGLFIGLPLALGGSWLLRLRQSELGSRVWNFLLGIPALAGTVGIIVLAIAVVTPQAAEKVLGNYRKAAAAAKKENQVKEAIVYYSRLRLIDSSNPEYTLELAKLYESIGDHDRAHALMNELTPPDSPGQPAAHLWQALNLLRTKAPSVRSQEAARVHLARVLQTNPDHLEANRLMIQLDLQTRRFAEAEQRLRRLAPTDSQSRVGLASLLTMRGRLEEARREARVAEERLAGEIKLEPDDVRLRTLLAEARFAAQDFAGSLAAADEGYRVATARSSPLAPSLSSQGARTLLAWGAATPAADPERWKRLMAAFDREPSDPMVAGALLKVALADPTDEATFLKTLPTVVGDEKRRSAELVLGAYSALRTTAGEATTHFQRATALDPKAPEHFERILTAAQLRPDASLDVIEAGRKVWPDQPGLQTLRGL